MPASVSHAIFPGEALNVAASLAPNQPASTNFHRSMRKIHHLLKYWTSLEVSHRIKVTSGHQGDTQTEIPIIGLSGDIFIEDVKGKLLKLHYCAYFG